MANVMNKIISYDVTTIHDAGGDSQVPENVLNSRGMQNDQDSGGNRDADAIDHVDMLDEGDTGGCQDDGQILIIPELLLQADNNPSAP
jgi:hypothetical protein